MSAQYTTAEVAKHKDESSGLWIIVDNSVYDITSAFSPTPPPGVLRARDMFWLCGKGRACMLTCHNHRLPG